MIKYPIVFILFIGGNFYKYWSFLIKLFNLKVSGVKECYLHAYLNIISNLNYRKNYVRIFA